MTAGLAFFFRHIGESYNFQAILFFVPPVLYQVDFAERSFANNAAELVLGQRHYVCGRGGGEVGPDQMGTKNKNFEDKILTKNPQILISPDSTANALIDERASDPHFLQTPN